MDTYKMFSACFADGLLDLTHRSIDIEKQRDIEGHQREAGNSRETSLLQTMGIERIKVELQAEKVRRLDLKGVAQLLIQAAEAANEVSL